MARRPPRHGAAIWAFCLIQSYLAHPGASASAGADSRHALWALASTVHRAVGNATTTSAPAAPGTVKLVPGIREVPAITRHSKQAGGGYHPGGEVQTGVPLVRHSKRAGGGYHPGSPLYARQQHIKKQQRAGAASVSGPSTTFLCIICLSAQYFLVYTALVVARTFSAQPVRGESSQVVSALEGMAKTVNFAPLLCVVFLVARLRALQLTRGDPEQYSLPQPWVQKAMLASTFAVLGQLVLLCGLAGGSQDLIGTCGLRIVNIVRFILLLLLSGGVAGVCCGIYSMRAPRELLGQGQPPLSHALWCTMCIAIFSFVVYVALAVASELGPRSRIARALQLATFTLSLAPMACILFIAARLRALQVNPTEVDQQLWATCAFYICTCSIFLKTLRALVAPLVLGGKASMGPSDGDVHLQVSSLQVTKALGAVRWFTMLFLYGGLIAVIVSIFLLENPRGGAFAPPVSPAMQCVIGLNVLFFGAHLVQFLVCAVSGVMQQNTGLLTASAFADSAPQSRAVVAVRTACLSVMFCPMLCVIFIVARLRALQLTRGLGAPQGWAQDCMYVASYSVLAQLLIAVGLGLGAVDADQKPKMVAMFEVVEFVLIASMHVAAVAVVVAAYVMTPETATGANGLIASHGHWLLPTQSAAF